LVRGPPSFPAPLMLCLPASVFRRAAAAIGTDYQSGEFWSRYLDFENQELKAALKSKAADQQVRWCGPSFLLLASRCSASPTSQRH
jgi:hypothetical protein